MKRRGFLGFLGAVPFAGPAAAKEAVNAASLTQAGFGSTVAGMVSVAPSMPSRPSISVAGKIVKMLAGDKLPEWKMIEIRNSANRERAFGLDADLASLRSVSASFKANEQRSRNINRLTAQSIASIGRSAERWDFMARVKEKFGVDVDWYE